MTYRFIASVAYGWHEELPPGVHVPTAGVAESGDEEGFALQFQGGFGEPDDQDVRLGMDSYCVVTPDQSTAYGCVRRVELEGNVLRITFDPADVDELGLDELGLDGLCPDEPVVEAVLRAPADDVARMREALTRILAYGRADARPVFITC
ncbi:Imm10 family immunity protein [Streptomyces sp. NPDC090025]|uniref:Imm10 family immunity protein n=1 Tax=Streptomyces sp. NPDC090025 TaxID=3365922 RepID=UPI00383285EF